MTEPASLDEIRDALIRMSEAGRSAAEASRQLALATDRLSRVMSDKYPQDTR